MAILRSGKVSLCWTSESSIKNILGLVPHVARPSRSNRGTKVEISSDQSIPNILVKFRSTFKSISMASLILCSTVLSSFFSYDDQNVLSKPNLVLRKLLEIILDSLLHLVGPSLRMNSNFAEHTWTASSSLPWTSQSSTTASFIRCSILVSPSLSE